VKRLRELEEEDRGGEAVLSGLTSKALQKALLYALLDNFRTPND